MFEFLFKYPFSVFAKGHFVLLGSWPRWVLALTVLGAAGALAVFFLRRRDQFTKAMRGYRSIVLWALDSALLALLLLLLWQPAVSITALKQQQNIVAIVIDDSRSMALKDIGNSREQEAVRLLDSGLLKDLRSHYQVRMYRLGADVDRIEALSQLTASQPSTQINKGLRQLADEAATLPIGSILLIGDGADNSGGVDLKTLAELQRRRLPVNTIGLGKTELSSDVEMDGFEVANKALEGSRLEAQITVRQKGFGGQHTRLNLSGGGKVLATREIVLNETGKQTETLEFNAGQGGVKSLEARIDPIAGEENLENNRLTRVLSVESGKHRILYVEGEPRWEYKFIRRAADDDPAITVVSMLRTTQNKIYRQGIGKPDELAEGFPSKPEELFDYEGIILGSVEEAFFTTGQAQEIKDFVERRGGGLLFLAGRWALSDGGYNVAPFAELLPVQLPARKNTFQRNFVAAELTDAGRRSLVCRIEDDADKSSRHWEILPYLANYQDPGTPKPGAVVLARVDAGGTRLPLLVTENYGRGRSGVFATAGSWRWRMQQPLGDVSQETFWRQLMRWTVGATPSRVVASTPNANLEDEGHIELRAEVRDIQYLPAGDAQVQAKVIGPDGSSETVALHPEPLSQGIYAADWDAAKAGSYVAEVTARQAGKPLGRDVLTFRREDGQAENFHREQNRELLQKLGEQTGGRYYAPREANRVAREIAFSEAGITGREIKEIWDMPAIFLLVLGLKSAEWLLRRRWGVV
jgi:uncharacterized membrane protein